jgi:hypothetical protein
MSYQFVHINLFRVLRCFNMDYPAGLMALYEQVLHDYVKPGKAQESNPLHGPECSRTGNR